MAAYKGTTVHGFPNLFLIVGPNTGLGHSCMVFMIESQIAYVRDAIKTMNLNGTPRSSRARPARLERRPPAPDGAHRVEHRRLLELVPRRARPQHDPVAAHHVHVPPAAVPVRRRGVRREARPLRRPDEDVIVVKTLDDKVVVITGAGSGIGRALALNLAARGALLALSDSDEVGLAETVDLARDGRRPRGAQRPPRRVRPRRLRVRTPRPSPTTSAGSTSWSTTPASRCRRLRGPRLRGHSTGSSASTSGASCTAPRSSCRT